MQNANASQHKKKAFWGVSLKRKGGKTHVSMTLPAAAGFAAICVIILAGLLLCISALRQMRSTYSASSLELEELKAEYDSLVSESEQMERQLAEDKLSESASKSEIEEQSQSLQKQTELYQKKLEAFTAKADELQKKIAELEKAKDDLYDYLNQIPYAPEITKASMAEIPQPLSIGSEPISKSAALTLSLENLESRVEAETATYESLLLQVEQLKPYLEKHPSIWPAQGRISSGFGMRQNPLGGDGNEFHGGVDIAAETGSTVAAAGGGIVKFSGDGGSFGLLVIIDHGMSIETYYGHNSKLLVNAGDTVERGQAIALSGSTGRSTAPHIHYEVRVNGAAVDPRKYLY
ncbi:MAG: peptidoglycan DD-metalloendopeptidase family protein [Clostridiales bacterium]|jgi:murein DD-endopeptidase MepM/ murein hydrolase activator NlpD|nr:peptidoglycan DD-metalloendopeptidase family protein [Clostridiales bacterium]